MAQPPPALPQPTVAPAPVRRSLWHDRNGGLTAIVAVALTVIVGMLGLGVEVGLWYAGKRSLQTAADAAALSGALERAKGNPAGVLVAARQEAARNSFNGELPHTILVRNPPESGSHVGNSAAVEVLLGEQQALLFSSLFEDGVTIAARAVAEVQVKGQACVLALHPTAARGIITSGSADIDMSGCVLAANSASPTAIDIGGSSRLVAESLWTVGDYVKDGSATLSLARPAVTHAWTLVDPYANVTLPPIAGCDVKNLKINNGTHTLSPGIYCGGMSFGGQSSTTLQPGTYYIDGGDFEASAGSHLRCACPNPSDGVTIILTSTGSLSNIGIVNINGGADLVLRAPSDGSAFTGLLFYQDPRAPSGRVSKFNGGASMSLTGAIYFREQQIEWAGNNNPVTPTCTQIIARTVTFTGNSLVVNTGCPEAGVEPIQITGVRIVE